MCAKLCASPLWSAPDPCDDPSKHRAKDGKHDQWDGPSHHRGDQWRRAGTQIPEQRPHSFTLQTPDGQKEQRRHKQSRQKSGDGDSLWSGHVQLIAIGQAGGSASRPSNPLPLEHVGTLTRIIWPLPSPHRNRASPRQGRCCLRSPQASIQWFIR